MFNVTFDLSTTPPPDFDDQAKATLQLLPVRSLIAAAEHPGLDPALRGRIVRMAWTRAVLLQDDASARTLLPMLETTTPELKQALDDYDHVQSREDGNFTAVLAILRAPGLSPTLDDREEIPPSEIDDFRRNWWCGTQVKTPDDTAPAFIAANDLEAARLESAKFTELPSGPEYLSGEALAWARSHPDDPRVPEALHLVVRCTRYGCSDSATGKRSRAAFRLLHRRYPKSEWTQRTPYWFD